MENKKPTLEDAKRIFAEHGHTLLEDIYENAHVPMRYICGGCGEIPEKGLRLYHCREGGQCYKCRNKKIGNAKGLTLAIAKQVFASHGHTLLEETYLGARVPMRYRCGGCGEVPEKGLSLNNCRKGQQCKECGSKKRAKSYSLTLEEAKQVFADHGHTLLAEVYLSGDKPMRYRCGTCEEISEKGMSLSHCKQGQQCRKCGNVLIGLRTGVIRPITSLRTL